MGARGSARPHRGWGAPKPRRARAPRKLRRIPRPPRALRGAPGATRQRRPRVRARCRALIRDREDGQMKTRDIMTPSPVTVGPKDRPAEIKRLMEAARVHHLPLVDQGRLVGLWLSTEEGPLVMVGPERGHEATPEADAEDTMAALLRGREAAAGGGGGQEP